MSCQVIARRAGTNAADDPSEPSATLPAGPPGLAGFVGPVVEPHQLYWACAVGLFVFCLLQIQVGVQRRSEFMVNLGVVFIALLIIATYINLVGSMARTGVMFLIGGVFLIVFGIYLEKKRRALMRQMKAAAV